MGVSIVGVSFDSPSKNQAWAEKEGYEFELWTDDDDHTLAETYGANSNGFFADRITVILDDEGTLVLEYAVSSVGTHPSQVLSDCEQLFGY